MATSTENLQDAAQSAKDALAQQKDGAASSLGNLAGTLRKAAQDSDGGDRSAARMAEWAADGLERVSSTLRSNDLNGAMRQVESFARSQPVAFFFAAAAAGFLATRFLKAGTQAQGDEQSLQAPSGKQSLPAGGAISKTDVSSTLPF